MDPIVEISTGRLRGRNRRGILSFKGIPYARPPVEELRFRAPQAPEAWGGVRDATRFGPGAPQPGLPARFLRGLIGVSPDGQSENCLSLNVWTPAADEGKRPVLVWIHGGAFVLGSGSTFLYRGSRMAHRGDVVVVTLNYRLGMLGGLHHPELQSRGVEANLGIRDQIQALRWVQENIAAFGGDPDNVTIFGESAGGMSVGTLLATPSARGLFQRAIAQSGALHNISDEGRAIQVAEAFLDELGLTPEDADALRYARMGDLQRAQLSAAVSLGLRAGSMPWQPCVDRDLLHHTGLEALAAGEVARVPTLIGTNRDEWRLFTMFDPSMRGLDEETLRRRLAHQLGGEEDAKQALELYRATRRGRTPIRLWESVLSDRVFHHPAQHMADALAGHGIPVWRYLFSWRPPLIGRRLGAAHGMELPFVFGTLRDGVLGGTLGRLRAARRISRSMQDAWIAFARDGRPGHERIPDWPDYDTAQRATFDFGPELRIAPGPFAETAAFWSSRKA